MVNTFNIDAIVKHFGEITLNSEEYEHLKKKTKVYPYINGKKWVCLIKKIDDTFLLKIFCTGVEVSARLVDTDTRVVKLRLKYHDGIAETEKDFECNILTRLGVKDLYCFGIRFSEDDANKVVNYLVKSEAIAPIIRTYTKLGWNHEGNVKLFRGHSALSSDGIYNELTYNGKLDLKPTGSLDKWLEMVRTEVLGSISMTFVLLLGFAGAVVSLLNTKKDIGSIMFNISNHSSKGKTTSAMLAASVFSNPALNKGCAISFNTTENALIQFIAGCGGHTIIVDEIALNNSKDFNRIMYSICNGRTKMRLNGDATQKDVTEFNSIVISTAEFDVVNEDAPNGIKARVFEIKDSLTTSAQNSDNIKECILENYAVAGEKFIKYLLQKDKSVFEEYENDKNILYKNCAKKKELSERILSKLATVLTTARYVNDVFDFNINEDEIINYILKLEKQITNQIKPEERLIEIIRQEVSKNSSRFIKDTDFVPSYCCGAIRTNNKYSEIQISQTVFEDMMDNHGITDWKTVLKILKEQDILQAEGDRLYKRVTLLKEVGRQKCYCFKVENSIQNQSIKAPQKDILAELDDIDIDIFAELDSAIID